MRIVLYTCLLLVNASLVAQPIFSTGVAIGFIIPTGNDLSAGYEAGLSLEPGLSFALSDKIDIGASVLVNGFMNNYNDAVTDYLILYGPLMNLSYKGILLGKIEVQPLLGVGYVWGQDFFVSSNQINSDRETTQILSCKGGYLRAGLTVPASEKVIVRLMYNVHRPVVSISEEAKNFFAPYNITSPLYGSIIDFPSNRMSFDNLMIAIALKL
ncbi:MAG: hypothetical protein JNK44_11615 [Cyclobacteriaceae bacterium]|nr:hypothetical protein [Cyclobacteriaceae bacterium]